MKIRAIAEIDLEECLQNKTITDTEAHEIISAIDLKMADVSFTSDVIKNLVQSMVEEMDSVDWIIEDGILPDKLIRKIKSGGYDVGF